MQVQVLHDHSQRVADAYHLGRSIGANDEQPCPLRPPRYDGQEVQRRDIAPVEIFEKQHQWQIDRYARLFLAS